MPVTDEAVFPVDVDNALLYNDRVQDDLRNHLEREFGAARRESVLGDILAAMKRTWGVRLTTIFLRQRALRAQFGQPHGPSAG